MQKELALQFQKEKFLSLRSISNYTHTVIQRLSQCLPSPESPEFLNCCSLPRSSKEVISHSASLLLSPQFSLSDAPFLGAPRRWSVFSTHWGKTWLDTSPVALPDPAAIPGELFCPSNGSGQGSAIQIVGTPFQEYHQVSCYLVHLGAPSLWPGWATSPVDQGAWVVGISLEPPEML